MIKSDSKGSEGSRFHLEWTADSFSPINKFKVEFKEISEDVWTVSYMTKRYIAQCLPIGDGFLSYLVNYRF